MGKLRERILKSHKECDNTELIEQLYLLKKENKKLKSRVYELELMVKKDLMTGLLNHQSFFVDAELMLEEEKDCYFMLIDLDDFKRINDTYGHKEGDIVLQDFSRMVKKVAGEHDLAGRIGGDEFAICFCNSLSEDEVRLRAKKLLQMMSEKKQKTKKHFPGASIGITKARDGELIKTIYERADKMLYRVKRSGKNNYEMTFE